MGVGLLKNKLVTEKAILTICKSKDGELEIKEKITFTEVKFFKTNFTLKQIIY